MSTYTIPLKYRKMENLHIVFWLFKDISWCLFWKTLGIVMIIPTLTISIIIAYRTRKMTSELCHNLAISLWIMANSYWMISEFVGFDENILFSDFTFKHLALIPFFLGVACLLYYYLFYKFKNDEELSTL